MAEWWTTEQVAEYLDITVGQVYESRKRKEWPGVVGVQRGRRLAFSSDLIESGPQEPETTNDPQEAILWVLQGIERKLGKILTELRSQAEINRKVAEYLFSPTFTLTTTDDEGEETHD